MANPKLVALASVVLLAVAAFAYAQGGPEKELKAGDHRTRVLAARVGRQDAQPGGTGGQDRRARLVSQSLHRWLNGRVQVAP